MMMRALSGLYLRVRVPYFDPVLLSGDRRTIAVEQDYVTWVYELPCGRNGRVLEGVCVPCAENLVRAPVDVPSAGGRACVQKCNLKERVSSSTCVSCPPGSTNTAGDDPSGEDTTCSTCDQNHRFGLLSTPTRHPHRIGSPWSPVIHSKHRLALQ
jgi:hypothetical protein